MRDQTATLQESVSSDAARECANPFLTKSNVWVRCGSRVKSICESCAELYRGDWAEIARSGVFDGPVQDFRFCLLTLTAPSFGQVHRVPRDGAQDTPTCGCGVRHGSGDAGLRGVPLDVSTYDYVGQVRWNRDSGVLWDRTRRRLRDRWDSLEYFIVREWQDRGVLHVHVLVRIERLEAPSAEALRGAARSATAFSKIDGSFVEWGAQAKCDSFSADGGGAKTNWYLSKALNYVMKDVAVQGSDLHRRVLAHTAALRRAAMTIRCGTGCYPHTCKSLVHKRYGSRTQVVSASRRTKNRTGWSFTGLTRTVQRRLRLGWFLSKQAEEAAAPAALEIDACEGLAARVGLELATRASCGP